MPLPEISALLSSQPFVGGLPVQFRAGIRRGDRNLNRERIDLLREPDRLFDRLLRFDRQPDHERPVHPDAELAAIAHELARGIEHQAFLDPVQDLLIAGFEADQQQPQPVIAQLLQRFVIQMRARIAGPRELQLLHALRDLDRRAPCRW